MAILQYNIKPTPEQSQNEWDWILEDYQLNLIHINKEEV